MIQMNRDSWPNVSRETFDRAIELFELMPSEFTVEQTGEGSVVFYFTFPFGEFLEVEVLPGGQYSFQAKDLTRRHFRLNLTCENLDMLETHLQQYYRMFHRGLELE